MSDEPVERDDAEESPAFDVIDADEETTIEEILPPDDIELPPLGEEIEAD